MTIDNTYGVRITSVAKDALSHGARGAVVALRRAAAEAGGLRAGARSASPRGALLTISKTSLESPGFARMRSEAAFIASPQAGAY